MKSRRGSSGFGASFSLGRLREGHGGSRRPVLGCLGGVVLPFSLCTNEAFSDRPSVSV
jgi:hypothetical protein